MVPRFAIRPANSYLPGIAVVELRMGNWTPSIVPQGDDQNVYLVVDDLGHLGQIWREAGVEMTDCEKCHRRPAGRPVQVSGTRHRL